MLLIVIFVSLLIVLCVVHLRGKYNENYWKKRGVVFYKKHKCVGPYWQYVLGNRALFEVFGDIYKYYDNEPAVGLGSVFAKALLVKDPVNVHHVTQVDFHSFNQRSIPISEDDVLANNVMFLHGPKWKLIRQKLTPLFTGAKLKNMYYILDKSAQDFVEFLRQNPNKLKGDAHKMHDTITHFNAAALSASVFGIGSESTMDSQFRKMVADVLKPTFSQNLKFLIGAISCNLYHILKLKIFGDHEDFFIGAIKQVLRQRKRDGVSGYDFADMCLKLQKEGTMHDPDTNITLEPTDEVLAAQAFFFFLAGVDPSTEAMFAAIMELGRNPKILKEVQDEVDMIFLKYNDQLTYDAISEVKYLDRVLNESMRMHPSAGYLARRSTRDTVLPVGNIPIEKGVKIIYPVFYIQNDPKFYPNPDVFDPDRFLRKEVSDMTYLPFGKGPRICIGVKYARLQIISGLMHFLRHYTVKTWVHEGGLKYEKLPLVLRLKNVDMEFIPRNI